MAYLEQGAKPPDCESGVADDSAQSERAHGVLARTGEEARQRRLHDGTRFRLGMAGGTEISAATPVNVAGAAGQVGKPGFVPKAWRPRFTLRSPTAGVAWLVCTAPTLAGLNPPTGCSAQARQAY